MYIFRGAETVFGNCDSKIFIDSATPPLLLVAEEPDDEMSGCDRVSGYQVNYHLWRSNWPTYVWLDIRCSKRTELWQVSFSS